MEGRAPPQRGTRRRAQYKPMLVRLVTLSERGAVVIAARSVRVSRVQTRTGSLVFTPQLAPLLLSTAVNWLKRNNGRCSPGSCAR